MITSPQKGGHAVVVGGGHAGGTAVGLLRQYGWTGPITLVGDEPIAPYQRPPLSKARLKGKAGAGLLFLRPKSFYVESGIQLHLSERVVAVDRGAGGSIFGGGELSLASGGRIAYDRLILALGSRPRRATMPGLELNGVLQLRTAADADRLKAALTPGSRLVIIGGGFIGLEVAASAIALGCQVTVIELQPRLLARVAHEALSKFVHDYHRGKGVEFKLAAGVKAIEGVGEGVTSVRLADGSQVGCDVVLLGIGAVPNQELAKDAGIECSDGVIVDLSARTSDPAIYAIGDCTRRPLPQYGETMWRLESVPNALEQAKQAAADLCGVKPPICETPWFWSDQYDLKLQIAGLALNADKTVVRGAPDITPFAVFHLDGHDRLMAVEAINAPAEFMAARQLIGAKERVDPVRLADPSIPMTQVAFEAI